jgi:hypothetical protein
MGISGGHRKVKKASAVFLPPIAFYIDNIAMLRSGRRSSIPARVASMLAEIALAGVDLVLQISH